MPKSRPTGALLFAVCASLALAAGVLPARAEEAPPQVESVLVEGPTLFSKGRLEALFTYHPGTPLDRSAVDEGVKKIEALYRRRGYLFAWVRPEYVERLGAGNRVDVVVHIVEGDPYRLGRVEFAGNSTTRDNVLRRELSLSEGEVLDLDAFRRGLTRISGLGFFRLEEDPVYKVDSAAKRVDVIIRGKEADRTDTQFGGGYNQLDGPYGQVQLSTRNFLGRGATVSAQLQLGGSSHYYGLSYTELWLLDTRWSLGATVFDRKTDFTGSVDDFVRKTTGLELSLGRIAGTWGRAALLYDFRDTTGRYDVLTVPPPPGAPSTPAATLEVGEKTSSVTPGWRWDTTDDPFDAKRGARLGLSLEIAGGAFGGDADFIRPRASGSVFFPLGKDDTLAVHVEGALIRPWGGSQIPINERFRIGGDRSVRGFPPGGIFPIDGGGRAFYDDRGLRLDGDRTLSCNLEAIQALGALRLVGFLDAGNSWLEGQPWSPLKLRAAAGVELRVVLPVFSAPLRLIYGIKLDPLTLKDRYGNPLPNGQESRGLFQLSFGTSF